MLKTNERISLIIPIHNESGNIEWHHERIVSFTQKKSYETELIYVDDGSTDNSLELIKKIAHGNDYVHYISFSRNFGKEAATTAGLRKASGQAAVMIDADGQHPIELIDQFIDKWRGGFEVVIGVRAKNTREGVVKKFGSKLFNTILNSLTSGNTVSNSTDVRLLDRRVIDEFIKLTERNRITRGLIDWLGFKRAYVSFDSPARHSGKAAYNYRKLVRLAIHTFVANSTKPLQFTGFMGALVMLLSALATLCLIFERYVFGDPWHLAVTGTAILALFLSFLIGLVLICQWLLAIYIESIHNETQNRPLYIVDEEN
jgi:glycosyltransferase involved in cell wall biosynthesis